MMRRYFLLVMLPLSLSLPVTTNAQEENKSYRVGYLTGGSLAARRDVLTAFRKRLRELGYVEGRNLTIDARGANGGFKRLPALVQQLVSSKPNVLLVATTPANLAARDATSTVPIVMVGVSDPVGVGLVSSLARPGGNITGITNITAELAGKRLQLLAQIVPTATRVAVLVNPDDPNAKLQISSAAKAAQSLKITLDPMLDLRSSEDLEPAFAAATRKGARAMLRLVDPTVSLLRKETIRYAAMYKMPIMYAFPTDAVAGGLVAYGPDAQSQYQQAAEFVHRIFQGAKASELPVEQPIKFTLAVNIKTATALGITIPPSILLRADKVIE